MIRSVCWMCKYSANICNYSFHDNFIQVVCVLVCSFQMNEKTSSQLPFPSAKGSQNFEKFRAA